MDWRATDKADVVASKVAKRINSHSAPTIYGENQVTLGPFIQKLYEQTNCKFIFVYRDGYILTATEDGWFPQLEEHGYAYNADHHCFYNDLSPNLLHTTLKKLNCTDIKVYKQESSNKEIAFEAVVTAKVP